MAIVVGVLLIAGANVAGLMLARGVARQREMAIRLALGGTRYRIVRQLVVESLVLAVRGAGLGLLLATWGTSLLLGLFVDSESAIAVSASPDARVLAFNFALALVTGLAFGLVPAWQTTRPDLAPTLKEQSGSVVSGGSVRLRKALVVVAGGAVAAAPDWRGPVRPQPEQPAGAGSGVQDPTTWWRSTSSRR